MPPDSTKFARRRRLVKSRVEFALNLVHLRRKGNEADTPNTTNGRLVMNVSKTFIALSAVGVVAALYHAWSEKAFSTNIFSVRYAPLASFFGIPYWLFGVTWYPLILAVGLLTTGLGRFALRNELLILLSVGNVFTAYLWYLDILVVNAYTSQYIFLYAVNYVLTGLVVFQNWRSDVVHGFAYGTIIGAVIGILFGPFGVAACGIGGGIFGALRNYAMPAKEPAQRREIIA
ncbi:MAG: hypothetical protein JRN52_03725 [Nitrososphaerota archaeon]|nr:hypothetical protein [Nitrososphaerota archaeon]